MRQGWVTNWLTVSEAATILERPWVDVQHRVATGEVPSVCFESRDRWIPACALPAVERRLNEHDT